MKHTLDLEQLRLVGQLAVAQSPNADVTIKAYALLNFVDEFVGALDDVADLERQVGQEQDERTNMGIDLRELEDALEKERLAHEATLEELRALKYGIAGIVEKMEGK